jgi:hypothetical protein
MSAIERPVQDKSGIPDTRGLVRDCAFAFAGFFGTAFALLAVAYGAFLWWLQ